MDALAIIDQVKRRGGQARLLGGRAVAYLCYERVPRQLHRVSQDIDLFTPRHNRKVLIDVLESLGSKAQREFNLLNGKTRLMYFAGETKIDVFIEEFQMCHVLPLAERVKYFPVTLPPADLLLTKLQIVEINEKDLIDSAALLLAMPPVENRGETPAIDAEYIAEQLATDWGLWRTITRNLEILRDAGRTLLQGEDESIKRLLDAVDTLKTSIDSVPKTVAWRLRSLVGEKVLWYEIPEEP